MISLRLN